VRVIVVALAMLGATPAFAGWQISTFKDQTRDRSEFAATLMASAGDGALRLQCMNGRPSLFIQLSKPVVPVETGLSYRFDSGEVVPRLVSTSRDGRDLWVWMTSTSPTAELSGRRRLRVTVFPLGEPSRFLDFDLSGADRAVAVVGNCK
jgi:hypothetical protein